MALGSALARPLGRALNRPLRRALSSAMAMPMAFAVIAVALCFGFIVSVEAKRELSVDAGENLYI